MKKIVCRFFIFLLISVSSQAQDLDSLLKVYNNKQQPDSTRAKAIGDVAWAYIDYIPDSSIFYAQKQLKLSQESKLKKYEAKALGTIGKAYSNKSEYSTAMDYYLRSLKLREEIGDKKGMGNCYTNIGIIYIEQSNYPKALENYLIALKIRQETNDKEGMGDCFTNIGTVYQDQGNYTKALEYYHKDLKICLEMGNKDGEAICYNNLGNVYHNQANYSKSLEYYLKAVKVFEETDNKPGMASCYNNIGSLYTYLSNYTKALEYHTKSLVLKRALEDVQGVGNCYINLAGLYTKLKDYKKAGIYSDSAMQLSKKIGDIDNERLSYQNLAEVNARTGHYKEAYEYHVKFKNLTDTIFNEENSKALGDLKTQFEVERKEAELKAEQEKKDVIAAAETRRQRLILLGVSLLGILLFVLAIIIFRNLRINQKKNRIITLQKQMVEVQKKEVENQKHIVEEHQKEILDSIHYAKRIQSSLLAHHEFLDENLPGNFVLFKPKDIVSGDFYWAASVNSIQMAASSEQKTRSGEALHAASRNLFYLAVCDSTGHGVPGAFMSLLNIGFLSEAIKERNILEPHKIFDYVRDRLTTTVSKEGQKDGFDGILLCFNFSTNEITYAASHNAPILISNNQLTELPKDKMPVGVGERKENFQLHTIHAKPGDTLYLYTDGYADQFGGEKGKKFKYKQLEDLLLVNHHLPLTEQQQLLQQTFENWRGNLEQVDDVCVIGIKL